MPSGEYRLMDTDTRNMILPGKSGIAVSGTLRGLELAEPHSLIVKPLANQRSRIVGFTELDRNGHLNNTRYLDWIDDLIPSDYHKEHPMREITICYVAEALEGEEIHIGWELGRNILNVDAHRADQEANHDHVFSAQVLF